MTPAPVLQAAVDWAAPLPAVEGDRWLPGVPWIEITFRHQGCPLVGHRRLIDCPECVDTEGEECGAVRDDPTRQPAHCTKFAGHIGDPHTYCDHRSTATHPAATWYDR